MKTKSAAFFIQAEYPESYRKKLRTRKGFDEHAVKVGSNEDGDIWRLFFNGLLSNRVYLILGKIVNSQWQDVGELKVWSRDETYVDVVVPVGHGCMFILIAP